MGYSESKRETDREREKGESGTEASETLYLGGEEELFFLQFRRFPGSVCASFL
jgi:hypothetical protein